MNLSQNPSSVNPLQTILDTANQTGRHITRRTLHETERGKLVIRADQRGYLLLEAWPANSGPTTRLTLAFWDIRAGQWVLSTSEERTQEWLSEAAELLGESPLPQPVDPVDAVAADLVAEAGGDFGGRLGRAVELVKSGRAEFPEHQAVYYPHGATGHYECQCGDARFRSPRSKIGCSCKHCWALFISDQVTQAAEAVATRKLTDRLEMSRRQRETALPVGVSAKGRMRDYL